MKVVLLAGGKGTRITEESEYRPKPMIEVGGMPILWDQDPLCFRLETGGHVSEDKKMGGYESQYTRNL